MKPNSLHSISVLGIAIAVLTGLSLFDWTTMTGNTIKNFNLFEDLFPKKGTTSEIAVNQPQLDPELSVFEEEQNMDTATIAEVVPVLPVAYVPKPITEAPVLDDGTIGIENYTEGPALERFHKALGHRHFRTVRIGVIGDSFIEGDLMTQNLRDQFQEKYGGRGVGYMNMHSDFPGFRQSVIQGGEGWTMKSVRDMRGSDTIRVLSGEYGIAEGAAKATYKGAKFSPRTQAWSRTSFIYLAPGAGTITITGSDGAVATAEVKKSDKPEILTLDAETTSATVTSNVPGLIGLGTYLTDPAGVQLDCMSIRGYSGITHRKLNLGLSAAVDSIMPYDLIIIEYGMNALSPDQTDYRTYKKALSAAIERIKLAYPQADILMLGISDRGEKKGGEVHSMATCVAMTEMQREAAAETGIHFWDMRAAMGGDDAVVQWRNNKLVNADYIHLNHKGGAEMASRLLHAILSTGDE